MGTAVVHDGYRTHEHDSVVSAETDWGHTTAVTLTFEDGSTEEIEGPGVRLQDFYTSEADV